MRSHQSSRLMHLILCAVFAALTAVLSQIQVPLPFTPVPINLALLSVLVCGGVLGSKYGSVSMIVYILLGAIGVPVFSGFTGGIGILTGPTGGYIIGYLAAAAIMGLFRDTKYSLLTGFAKGVPAVAACYALGTAWFMISTNTGLIASLTMCVFPFIPGDVLKIIAAVLVCTALKRPMRAIAGRAGA